MLVPNPVPRCRLVPVLYLMLLLEPFGLFHFGIGRFSVLDKITGSISSVFARRVFSIYAYMDTVLPPLKVRSGRAHSRPSFRPVFSLFTRILRGRGPPRARFTSLVFPDRDLLG